MRGKGVFLGFVLLFFGILLLPKPASANPVGCGDLGPAESFVLMQNTPFSAGTVSGSITTIICQQPVGNGAFSKPDYTGLYEVSLNPSSSALTSFVIGASSGAEILGGTSPGVTLALSVVTNSRGEQVLDISFTGLGGSGGGLDASFSGGSGFELGQTPVFINGRFIGDVPAGTPEPPTLMLLGSGLASLALLLPQKRSQSRSE